MLRAEQSETPLPPLVAIGLVSAAPYRERRAAIRESWFRFSECSSGDVLARFVIAQPTDAREAKAMDAEVHTAGDVVMLPTGVSGRVWSPLHTTFRWLAYATSQRPFRDASYIAKMDDDVFLFVPELALHLRKMRELPLTAPTRNVLYGVFYWTSYIHAEYMHTGSTYDMLTAQKASSACIRAGSCKGSFPFTTGAMQLLSRPLAREIALGAQTVEHIERSKGMLSQSRLVPAFEDVWMGCAPPPPDRTRDPRVFAQLPWLILA